VCRATPRSSTIWTRLFAQVKHEKNRLDVVFANAGIAKYARLGTITEDFCDWIFNINVKGAVFTVQKALPLAGWRVDRSEFVPSSGAKDYLRTVSTAPPKLRFARSRGHGRQISKIVIFG